MFAGMMARPRAISLRTTSGSIFSRPATKAISSVITPWRAKCICETLRPSPLLRTSDPFAAAVSANLFSIQPSRTPILPPEEIPHAGYLSREANYRTAPRSQQPARTRDDGSLCRVGQALLPVRFDFATTDTERQECLPY